MATTQSPIPPLKCKLRLVLEAAVSLAAVAAFGSPAAAQSTELACRAEYESAMEAVNRARDGMDEAYKEKARRSLDDAPRWTSRAGGNCEGSIAALKDYRQGLQKAQKEYEPWRNASAPYREPRRYVVAWWNYKICLMEEFKRAVCAKPGGATAPSGGTADQGGGKSGPAGKTAAATGRDPRAARQCLSLGDATTGTLSTESSSLRNNCKVAVGYTFCVDSRNGGGVFGCRAQKFGSGLVGPGKSDGISIMGADSPFTVHWYECQAQPKRSYPAAVYGKFANGRVVAECR